LSEQPWRNPRPAPELEELRRRVSFSQFIPAWLRAWWPALVWACIIFTMSTDSFSATNTGSYIGPLLHWIFPSLSSDQLEGFHYFIRKTAHFSEYFIFYLLLFRGARGSRKGWRWTWALSAWFLAACYSGLDEVHQAFIASRTASPYDSLIDSLGAFVAMIFLTLWFHRPTAEKARSDA